MLDQTFSVTFWGVRGGYPKPGPTTIKFGGNTTCLEIRAGPHLIIVDAGTGIIGLGEKLVAQHLATGKPIVAMILFTHTHHDHTHGFPFFTPAYLGSSVLHIFGPKLLHQGLEEVLASAMLPPLYPVRLDEMSSMRVIRNVSENEIITCDAAGGSPQARNVYHEREAHGQGQVKVRIMRSYAHPQGIFIYRIELGGKKLVVATDVEGYAGGDKRLIKFAQGADLLIHDAEYTAEEYLNGSPPKQGWGHSTWEMAVEAAQAAGAKKLALVHHSVHHDDTFMEGMERQAQARFPAAIVAREGLTLDVKA
ncbi:MAG: MBL fold metallo-hydrolase [Chloroflexi bacterium]|nr:MAG: MBL fold metallo-hydrolase [Anaerolineaceae bacterium 4572_32.2]RLC76338.1 MAG: MBL fold metallo-hydrolase [Chloroflexota bacterium]RLC84624.1 MAG: MBL fold metallo-hydrolase [Chloroflexota bacterium]HEY71912.1 MBL fold metallo-hydrolase [Thermoflexia bacterium]